MIFKITKNLVFGDISEQRTIDSILVPQEGTNILHVKSCVQWITIALHQAVFSLSTREIGAHPS